MKSGVHRDKLQSLDWGNGDSAVESLLVCFFEYRAWRRFRI